MQQQLFPIKNMQELRSIREELSTPVSLERLENLNEIFNASLIDISAKIFSYENYIGQHQDRCQQELNKFSEGRTRNIKIGSALTIGSGALCANGFLSLLKMCQDLHEFGSQEIESSLVIKMGICSLLTIATASMVLGGIGCFGGAGWTAAEALDKGDSITQELERIKVGLEQLQALRSGIKHTHDKVQERIDQTKSSSKQKTQGFSLFAKGNQDKEQHHHHHRKRHHKSTAKEKEAADDSQQVISQPKKATPF